MVSGDVPLNQKPMKIANIPVMLHMTLVIIIGIYIPDFLNQWFHTAVELLR
jgi:hydrogenase-4 component F